MSNRQLHQIQKRTRCILDHYLFANTPSFLFERLRREPAVSQLATDFSADQLAGFVLAVDQDEKRTALSVAAAYCALVALTFHNYKAAKVAMESLSTKNLNWVPAICQLWESVRLPSTTVESRLLPIARPTIPNDVHTSTVRGSAQPLPGAGPPQESPTSTYSLDLGGSVQ